ncbi:MAG: hypothetical protein ABIH27_07505 [Candidatus Omnitrophota bacterium]
MCYIFPTASAIITSAVWHKTKNIKIGWLSLMFLGGSLFGLIDHLWNGEIFFISKNIIGDLMLGITITAAIFACWVMVVFVSKKNSTLAEYAKLR